MDNPGASDLVEDMFLRKMMENVGSRSFKSILPPHFFGMSILLPVEIGGPDRPRLVGNSGLHHFPALRFQHLDFVEAKKGRHMVSVCIFSPVFGRMGFKSAVLFECSRSHLKILHDLILHRDIMLHCFFKYHMISEKKCWIYTISAFLRVFARSLWIFLSAM